MFYSFRYILTISFLLSLLFLLPFSVIAFYSLFFPFFTPSPYPFFPLVPSYWSILLAMGRDYNTTQKKKFTLKQAMKTQRGSKGIDLFFF